MSGSSGHDGQVVFAADRQHSTGTGSPSGLWTTRCRRRQSLGRNRRSQWSQGCFSWHHLLPGVSGPSQVPPAGPGYSKVCRHTLQLRSPLLWRHAWPGGVVAQLRIVILTTLRTVEGLLVGVMGLQVPQMILAVKHLLAVHALVGFLG